MITSYRLFSAILVQCLFSVPVTLAVSDAPARTIPFGWLMVSVVAVGLLSTADSLSVAAFHTGVQKDRRSRDASAAALRMLGWPVLMLAPLLGAALLHVLVRSAA